MFENSTKRPAPDELKIKATEKDQKADKPVNFGDKRGPLEKAQVRTGDLLQAISTKRSDDSKGMIRSRKGKVS